MKRVLITGYSGLIGSEAVTYFDNKAWDVIGLDNNMRADFFGTKGDTTWNLNRLKSATKNFRHISADIRDRAAMLKLIEEIGPDLVVHAAAQPSHDLAATRPFDDFDVNAIGTLNLLEEAVAAGVESFIYPSTTSVFGDALVPPPGAAAAWITEEVTPVPKNIYGVTKAAAEDLCELFHRNQGLACIVLRTSRFFPEEDDNPQVRKLYSDANAKANEYLYRRVDIEDAVSAHLLAAERAAAIGFRKYIISATTPFCPGDLAELRVNAPRVVRQRVPGYAAAYDRRGWTMFPSLDRVYVNERARNELGWQPRYDFGSLIDRLQSGDKDMRSPLARLVGAKGYHAQVFADGPFPVE